MVCLFLSSSFSFFLSYFSFFLLLSLSFFLYFSFSIFFFLSGAGACLFRWGTDRETFMNGPYTFRVVTEENKRPDPVAVLPGYYYYFCFYFSIYFFLIYF